MWNGERTNMNINKIVTRSSARLTHRSQHNPSLNKKRIQKAIDSSSDEDVESDGSEHELQVPKTYAPITPRKSKSRTPEDELKSPATPPKQNKLFHHGTQSVNDKDSTRDTPSKLFKHLSLRSPTKQSSKSNKKSLFTENQNETTSNSIRKEPEIVSIESENVREFHKSLDKEDAKRVDSYQNARQALHSSFPKDMPGREVELEQLKLFLEDHLMNKSSGSLYISGPPGTGKTASLNLILHKEEISSEFKEVYVNCTAIKSPTAIYSKIAKELEIKVNGKTEKDYQAGIEFFFKKKHRMILLVLDEIDQLENKNQSILYTIFEWPSKFNSQLILIGIANALDLTDRTLPRLQVRCNLKPKLMHFAPYTKQQIINIFTDRLKTAGALDVFTKPALQMLAGKVAAISGDVRRALDIGRRVVELVDQSRTTEALQPIENVANLLVDNEMKSVEMKEVMKVLNNVYGTSQSLTESSEDTFPLQQKIIICSLLLILNKAKNNDVTVGKLHEVYRKVCTKRHINAVDQTEFVGLCSLIETRGIIRVSGKKEPRLHKVSLEWDEEEVSSALKDKQLISTILQDVSCLGKL